MPPVVGALVAGAITAGATLGTQLAIGAGLVISTKAAVAAFTVTFLARLTTSGRSLTSDSEQVIAASNLPSRWIVGRARVGGQIVFYYENNEEGYSRRTPRPHTAHLAIVLSEGSLDSIEKVWINGEEIELDATVTSGTPGYISPGRTADHDGVFVHLDSQWKNNVQIWEYFAADGTGGHYLRENSATSLNPDGTVFRSLWTNDHRLEGKSWVYVKLVQNDYESDVEARLWDRFPEINFLVKGVKMTWPGNTTPTWSESAAVIRYWWLTERCRISPDMIDEDSFNHAHTICSETVDYSSQITGDLPSHGYNLVSTRYPINGVITSEDDAESISQEFDFCWQGHVVEADAKLYFRPGVTRVSAGTLTEKDIINVDSIRTAPILQERINAMSASISQSLTNQYQEQDLRRQKLSDSEITDRDRGQELWTNIGNRRFIIDPLVGARLLHIALRRVQHLSSYVYRVKPGQNLQWLTLIPSDILHIENPSLGIDVDTFIVGIATNEDWSLTLNLQPYSDSDYDTPSWASIAPKQPGSGIVTTPTTSRTNYHGDSHADTHTNSHTDDHADETIPGGGGGEIEDPFTHNDAHDDIHNDVHNNIHDDIHGDVEDTIDFQDTAHSDHHTNTHDDAHSDEHGDMTTPGEGEIEDPTLHTNIHNDIHNDEHNNIHGDDTYNHRIYEVEGATFLQHFDAEVSQLQPHVDHTDRYGALRSNLTKDYGMTLPVFMGGDKETWVTSLDWEDIPQAVIVRLDNNRYSELIYHVCAQMDGEGEGSVRLFNMRTQRQVGETICVSSSVPLPYIKRINIEHHPHPELPQFYINEQGFNTYVLQAKIGCRNVSDTWRLRVWGAQGS